MLRSGMMIYMNSLKLLKTELLLMNSVVYGFIMVVGYHERG